VGVGKGAYRHRKRTYYSHEDLATTTVFVCPCRVAMLILVSCILTPIVTALSQMKHRTCHTCITYNIHIYMHVYI
jgi:hypothetical protein